MSINVGQNITNIYLQNVLKYIESRKINQFVALKKEYNKQVLINSINNILIVSVCRLDFFSFFLSFHLRAG